jgi:FlaA1/EpsC-like NDP-sugar epimerase
MVGNMYSNMRRLRGLVITLFHLVMIIVSLAIAFLLRFDFSLRPQAAILIAAVQVAVPVKMLTFFIGGLHKGWWRYAGLMDLVRLLLTNLAASALTTLAILMWIGPQFPRSVYIIDFLLCFLFCAGARFSVRLYNEALRSELSGTGKGILIYGAGSAGRTLVREIRSNPNLRLQIVGFIDDNRVLRSSLVMDVPVLGNGRDIPMVVEDYRNRVPNIDEVIIAMPSATGRQMREAHANCRAAGVTCRTIPGISDLLNGKYLSSQIRSISLEDLLGREQIRLDEDRIQKSIAGKSILITGAAGSIGSELCRQTANFMPRVLVALDQAESELFKIEHELRQKHPGLDIVPVVGDIRDIQTLEDVVRLYSIESIYHAAAYKHVPMMERYVLEAVRNNIFGTWNLVKVAHKYRVPEFLMISSDKAVNPTSVMGTTKRIAELILSAMSNARDNTTRFVSVRFGNVLGSNGSVVPLFQSQIAAGGPITVTDAEMRRYFMSIREAVLLVLQASTMGKGAEIFVLDMGDPVRILDLAHNMIQLAGLVPDEDIEVRITGLRPGEKLFEEITLDGEDIVPTYHEKIRIFKGQEMEPGILSGWLSHLQLLLGQGDVDGILRHFTLLVPEYKPQRLQKATKPAVLQVSTASTYDGVVN